MRSPRRALIESLREDLDEDRRYVDVAAQLRVYRRGADGSAEPAELLPRIYGGRFDNWTGCFSEENPGEVREISCHPGQLDMLVYEGDELRTLLVGAPGGGKTFCAVAKITLLAIDRPNSIGGAVAPTIERRGILWDDLLNLLEPFGWVAKVSRKHWEIRLVNGTIIQIRSARRQARATGTPLQGYSWDWAVEDEQQNIDDAALLEVQFRGRRAGREFRIYSTATNQLLPEFQLRLERYRDLERASPPKVRILKFRGYDNVFVDEEHWENQRSFMTTEDFDRLINAEDDVDKTGLVYPKWDRDIHLREVPALAVDITEQITEELFGEGRGARYVVGQDFGDATNLSVILKAFREPNTNERIWWAVDEIQTEGSASTPAHANALLAKYRARDLMVLADPHTDEKTNDRSDYRQFRNAGLRIAPASGERIGRKHRFSMVNALLADASKKPKARLFVACDANRIPKCPRLVESLRLYRLEDVGKKGPHDISHASDALGYGLFRWERIRGAHAAGEAEQARSANDQLLRQMANRLRKKR